MAQILIAAKANVNGKDRVREPLCTSAPADIVLVGGQNEGTALDWAAANRHQTMVELLKAAGAC